MHLVGGRLKRGCAVEEEHSMLIACISVPVCSFAQSHMSTLSFHYKDLTEKAAREAVTGIFKGLGVFCA